MAYRTSGDGRGALEASRRRLRVDSFGQRDEPHTDGGKFVEQQNQVPEIPPEPIEPPSR